MTSKLIIDLELIGFVNNNKINYSYEKLPLKNMDLLTYKYINSRDFFEKNKKYILRKLIYEKEKYGLEIAPIDIDLGSEGVYILKKEKKIRALFQEISFKGQILKLEDVVKNRMMKGNLNILYKCDKLASHNENYQSIFMDIDPSIKERLDFVLSGLTNFDTEEIEAIWQFLKKDERIPSIIRFLLTKESVEDMFKLFQNTILKIVVKNQSDEENNLKRYRSPYKDS